MFPIERNQSERDARQLSDEGLFPGEVFADQPFIEHEHDGPPPHHESEHHEHEPSVGVCHDSKNEVYQQCGSKCVLGCRYAAASSSGISVSKNDCNKNDCVEGCFCKTGLVRHQTKCIPALECPIRKCHHRDEVYVSYLCSVFELLYQRLLGRWMQCTWSTNSILILCCLGD